MLNRPDSGPAENFPVARDQDGYVARREFSKFLGLTSLAFLVGTSVAVVRKLWRQSSSVTSQALRIGSVDDVPVGGYKLFRYPTADDPCILLRLESQRFVAFTQNCTHLTCPVHFNAADQQLACPCHHGFFSAADGRPIAGPPRRPLTQFPVAVNNGTVWVRAAQMETTT